MIHESFSEHLYNARYYDPVIGQFVSPDTIVPEPGRVDGYNRYMYVMGNPLKLVDPTGHCATAEDGSPDRVNDAECWSWADEYYGSWYADPDYFSGGWDITPDDWLASVATQDYATTDFIKGRVSGFWSPKYREMGVHHAVYNPMPDMHAPIDGEVRVLGQVVVEDAFACANEYDCGRLLDDVSLAVAVVYAGCVIGSFGSCSIVSATGTFVGGLGAVMTGYDAYQDESTWTDAGVSAATTFVGGKYGNAGKGAVGVGASLFQRVWDGWRD